MTALISATSPERKRGQEYQVKSDLGDSEYQPAEKPTRLSQINLREIHYHIGLACMI